MLEEWRNLTLKTEGSIHQHYYSAFPKSKPRLGIIHTVICGKHFEFLTGSGVFSKDRLDLGTRLLIENMVLPEVGCALDLGCGYGAVGLAAATFRPHMEILLVDINQRAVWLTRQNAERNSLCNAEVRKGNMYEAVGNVFFKVILSNPPISAGMETVNRMISEAPQHLVLGGTLQMVVRSKICGDRLLSCFSGAFGNVRVLARGSGYRVLFSQKC